MVVLVTKRVGKAKFLVCIYNFTRKVKFKDVLFCKKYILAFSVPIMNWNLHLIVF